MECKLGFAELSGGRAGGFGGGLVDTEFGVCWEGGSVIGDGRGASGVPELVFSCLLRWRGRGRS